MAIDNFDEAMSAYLAQQLKEKDNSLAAELRSNADKFESGTPPDGRLLSLRISDSISHRNKIIDTANEVRKHVTSITQLLADVQIAPPPVDILFTEKAQQVLSEQERVRQIDEIKSNLGKPDVFNGPAEMSIEAFFAMDAEESNDVMHVRVLADTQRALNRGQIQTVGQILAATTDQLMGLRRFGGVTGLNIVTERLQKKGFTVHEDVAQ